MAVAFENIREGINVLRQFLVPKVFTARLVEFAEEEGILPIIREVASFTSEEFCNTAAERLGYKTESAVRKRMLIVLLDFLEECGHISRETSDVYRCRKEVKPATTLSVDEMKTMERLFSDQAAFFSKCMDYAGKFLRGGDYLYCFDRGTEETWDRFLGNYEFNVARNILIDAMHIGKTGGCGIMDLCYGTGHGLKVISRDFPDADITAIDFTDTMRPFAMSRIGSSPAKIRWVDSSGWKGFGGKLPFTDMTFDRIFFSCGDPYIPEHEREAVYRDIFRILKPDGILGVVAWGYPDRARMHIQNEWIRKNIYIHDFSESVCKGWHGFRDIDSTITMAGDIGFVKANSLFNNFYMLDSAIWIFKRP